MNERLRERIAKVICDSSLWNIGKDSHNALSELTESILALLTPELKEGKRPLCDGTKKINDALIDGDRTCPCCEGRGYVGVLATTSMGKCILCNGTGKQPPLQCDMNMPNIRGGGKQPILATTKGCKGGEKKYEISCKS